MIKVKIHSLPFLTLFAKGPNKTYVFPVFFDVLYPILPMVSYIYIIIYCPILANLPRNLTSYVGALGAKVETLFTCLFKVDILGIFMMFEFPTMDALAWKNKTS